MEFAFGNNKDPKVAVQQLAIEMVEFCSRQLDRPDKLDSNIHELRKSCKKFRALLRLIRQRIDKQTFARENVVFRDLARPLSACRESLVRIATFDSLHLPNPGVQKILLSVHQSELRKFQTDSALHITMLDQLAAAAGRVHSWPLDLDDFQQLRQVGLVTHEKGREIMLLAQSVTTSRNLHECRKQVKYLGYQIGFLSFCQLEQLPATLTELDLLGDALGREHDLADLAQWANENRQAMADCDSVLEAIQTRQQHLRPEIFDLANPVFWPRNRTS